MSLWRQLARGVRNLTGRKRADDEIADEVNHYLVEAAASLEAGGLSPEDARRAALAELGSAAAVRERVREYGWENVVETVAADLRHGVRQLLHRPVFSFVTMLTLALGIGASTAIFSAINPILLQPLPYRDAGQLMMIWDVYNGARDEAAFGTYLELRQRNRSFESLAAMRPLQATLTGTSERERLEGQYVSASYFHVLGVQPSIGRDFQEADDQPGRPFVALISDSLWHRRFGGDRTIVGRQISIEDTPVTVIGVMPKDFENVLRPSAEIWSPLMYDQSLPPNGREWGRSLQMIGRLRPGTNPESARLELDRIARTKVNEFSRPASASLGNGFIANRLQDELTRGVRPVLIAVLGAVTLLLAIACVNVTNLLLARGVERRSELAVRAALGASRWRLTRQLLFESLLIAGLAGVCGSAVAQAGVRAVSAVSPAELPRTDAIHLDGWVLVFAIGLTTLVGLVVGVVPAFHASRAAMQGGIQQRSMRITAGHTRTRRALVVVQIAIAVVLLIGAGLILRSVQHLLAVPTGFDPSHRLTLQVQGAGQRFRDADETNQFFTQALDAVRHVPGVTAAGFSSQLPLTGDEDVWGVRFPPNQASPRGHFHDGYRHAVSPGYFEAMGIPLRRGRYLNASDNATAPGAAVINESFARYLGGVDPIGQRLRVGPQDELTIVGIVADVKHTSLSLTPADSVYMTSAQFRQLADRARWFVIHVQGDATALTPAIRQAIWSVDGKYPILRVATMQERVDASEAERRFALMLFEVFGVVALVLATIGTYSLLAGSVTERTREIAVRSALGASRFAILSLVLRQGMILACLGVFIGSAGAGMSSSVLATLIFGVSELDTTTYLSVAGVLAGVSAIACASPAWHAVRIHPSTALNAE